MASLFRSGRVAAFLRRWLLEPHVLLALIALSVWLLEGFGIGPLNDGWIGLGLKTEPVSLLRQGSVSRVFGSLPRALGTRLTDGGFEGWQVMLLLLTCLRASLFYDTMRRLLPGQRLFAFACGLLALFHPADSAWFWLDATGAHFGFVLALAACWAALAYLQGGTRAWLLACLLFQFMACFTYSAYIPLMFAFPLGAWLLLRMQQRQPPWQRLLGVTSLLPLFGVVQLLLLLHGSGHESHVADFRLHAVLMGYLVEARRLFSASLHAFSGFKWLYLAYAAVPALLVGAWAAQPASAAGVRPRAMFHAVMLLGLVALAAASYFPYSLSEVRFGSKRQLMAAGIFLYAACAYLFFVLLPPYLARWPRLGRWLFPAALMLLAAATGAVGLEKRAPFVAMYRWEERVLSQLAAAVPRPEPGTTLVVRLHSRGQAQRIPGFYNRSGALGSALQVMYSDTTLQARFMRPGPLRTHFAPEGLRFRQQARRGKGGRRQPPQYTLVPYARTILIDYPVKRPAAVLGRGWLQSQAGELDVSAYRPGEIYSKRPAPRAVICTMLEKKFRPPYCGG